LETVDGERERERERELCVVMYHDATT